MENLKKYKNIKIKGSALIKLKNKEVTEIKELTDYNLGNRNRGLPNGWRTEDLIYTDPFIPDPFIPSGMYGSIKGIAGNAIQTVQLLELPSNDKGDTNV